MNINMLQWGRQGWHQPFTMNSKPGTMDLLSWYQPKQRRKPLSARAMGLSFHTGAYQPGWLLLLQLCGYEYIVTLTNEM